MNTTEVKWRKATDADRASGKVFYGRNPYDMKKSKVKYDPRTTWHLANCSHVLVLVTEIADV